MKIDVIDPEGKLLCTMHHQPPSVGDFMVFGKQTYMVCHVPGIHQGSYMYLRVLVLPINPAPPNAAWFSLVDWDAGYVYAPRVGRIEAFPINRSESWLTYPRGLSDKKKFAIQKAGELWLKAERVVWTESIEGFGINRVTTYYSQLTMRSAAVGYIAAHPPISKMTPG